MKTPELLPGISFQPWEEDVSPTEPGLIVIGFCTAGRRMYHLRGNCIPLSPQQLILYRSSLQTAPHTSLTGREQGCTLLVDIRRFAPSIMEAFCGNAADSLQRLTAENGCVVLASERLTEIMQTIMEDENSRRLKCMELLLVLETSDRIKLQTCTEKELQLAVSTADYALSQLQEHFTVKTLAENAGISQTRLKEIFTSVYGMPVYRFLRNQKMHRAADLLRETDCRVIDIANEFGYDNPSKFARAFTAVMGMPPSACRRSGRSEHSGG